MKSFAILLAALLSLAAAAAEQTGFSFINTGKKASIALAQKSPELKHRQGALRDPKTHDVRYAFLVMSGECRNGGRERTVKAVFDAADGQLELVAGHPKARLVTWTSFKVNGKDLLEGKPATFISRRFKIKELEKKERFTVEARFRSPNRRESDAARSAARKAARSKKSRAQK